MGLSGRSARVRMWMVALFGFFLIARPFTDYMTEYCIRFRRFPAHKLVHEVFPVWTYTTPLMQLIAGLFSELSCCGHKWVMFIGSVSSAFATIFVTIPPIAGAAHSSFFEAFLIVSQVLYSLYFASHAAYFGVRYSILPSSQAHCVTGVTRAAMLFGHVLSGLLGQLVYTFVPGRKTAYLILLALNIGASFPCIIVSLILPSPAEYSHLDETEPICSVCLSEDDVNDIKVVASESLPCWKEVWKVVCTFFTNFRVAFWSLAVIVTSAAHYLVFTYYQALLKRIDWADNYNGIASSVMYFCAAWLVCFGPPILRRCLLNHGEWLVVATTPLLGACLLGLWMVVPQASDPLSSSDGILRHPLARLIVAYVILCTYHILYEFLNACAYAQIATHLRHRRFTSIFAINACVQVPLQIVLQLAASDAATIFATLGWLLVGAGWGFLLLMVIRKVFLAHLACRCRRELDINS